MRCPDTTQGIDGLEELYVMPDFLLSPMGDQWGGAHTVTLFNLTALAVMSFEVMKLTHDM